MIESARPRRHPISGTRKAWVTLFPGAVGWATTVGLVDPITFDINAGVELTNGDLIGGLIVVVVPILLVYFTKNRQLDPTPASEGQRE